MKQIFDWLRGELNKEIEWYKTHGSNEDLKRGIIGATNRALTLTNEAEKQWKQDCCEWKPTHLHNHARFSNCMVKFDELHRQDVECFNFCPYCGKRIKISEVE